MEIICHGYGKSFTAAVRVMKLVFLFFFRISGIMRDGNGDGNGDGDGDGVFFLMY